MKTASVVGVFLSFANSDEKQSAAVVGLGEQGKMTYMALIKKDDGVSLHFSRIKTTMRSTAHTYGNYRPIPWLLVLKSQYVVASIGLLSALL
ncbi:conserved hypothetical protein [Ricinus communis]|uniref:Uncharacterized protein n=1 Tax=Ricinus communis TaxID=3988 RepID=B9SDQ8_RICCO|nr:conserved hypothetical protein [Ricinus communis]